MANGFECIATQIRVCGANKIQFLISKTIYILSIRGHYIENRVLACIMESLRGSKKYLAEGRAK